MGLLKKKHHQPIQVLQSKNRNGLPTAPEKEDQSKADARNFATQAALLMFQKPLSVSHDTPPPMTNEKHQQQQYLPVPRRASSTSVTSSSTAGAAASVRNRSSLNGKKRSVKRSTSTNSNLSALNTRNNSSSTLASNCAAGALASKSSQLPPELKQSVLSTPTGVTKNKRYSAFEPSQQIPHHHSIDEFGTEGLRASSPAIISNSAPDKTDGPSLAASAASLAIKSSKANNSQDNFLVVSPFSKPTIPGIHSNGGSPRSSNKEDYFHPGGGSFSSTNSFVSSLNVNDSNKKITTANNKQGKPQKSKDYLNVIQHEVHDDHSFQDHFSDHFGGSFDGFDNHCYATRSTGHSYSSKSNSSYTRSDSNSRSLSNLEDDFHRMNLTLDTKLGWNDSTGSLNDLYPNDLLAVPPSSPPTVNPEHSTISRTTSAVSIPTIKIGFTLPMSEQQPPTPTTIHLSPSPKSVIGDSKFIEEPIIRAKSPLSTSYTEERPLLNPQLHYSVPRIPSSSRLHDTSPKQNISTDNLTESLQPAFEIKPNMQKRASFKIPSRKAPSSDSLSMILPRHESTLGHFSPPKSITSSGNMNGREAAPASSATTESTIPASSILNEIGSSLKRSVSPKRKPPPMSPVASDSTFSYPPTSSITNAPSSSSYIQSSDLENLYERSNSGVYDTDDVYVCNSEYLEEQEQGQEEMPQYPTLVKPKLRHLGSSTHRVHPSFSTSKKIKAIADPQHTSSHGFKRNAKNMFKKGLKSAGYNTPSSHSPYHNHSYHHNHHGDPQITVLDSSEPGNGFADAEETMKPVQLKTTMRKEKKSDKFNEEKPWKQHNDRHYITDQEKKRYQGVWASNKGLYIEYLDAQTIEKLRLEKNEDINPALAASKISASAAVIGVKPVKDSKEQAKLTDEFKDIDLILNIVVRDLWSRSKLPNDLLDQIYKLVDIRQDGFLDKKSFIVGMWLVDQCLYGRKLPKVVAEDLWNSAIMNVNVLIKNKKGYKKK